MVRVQSSVEVCFAPCGSDGAKLSLFHAGEENKKAEIRRCLWAVVRYPAFLLLRNLPSAFQIKRRMAGPCLLGTTAKLSSCIAPSLLRSDSAKL